MEIDFVLPWVDGADPAWQAQKARFAPAEGQDAREARFRDWGTLRYWFRGVERFAPWVRKIHFITWGHVPDWLRLDHPKVNLVRHEDYIPAQYLPTFSSHPIELNIHRIQGLSDHFVYFNDDIFLTAPMREEDFFRHGLAVDTCAFGVAQSRTYSGTFAHVFVNNTALINSAMSRKNCRRLAMRKWLSPANGLKNVARTLALVQFPYFTGFSCTHLAVAYEKRTFEEVWEAAPGPLDATCRRRFRSIADMSQLAMRSWRLAKGDFVPAKLRGKACFFHAADGARVGAKYILEGAYPMLCLNDEAAGFDFETEKRRLLDAFAQALPDKCSFER